MSTLTIAVVQSLESRSSLEISRMWNSCFKYCVSSLLQVWRLNTHTSLPALVYYETLMASLKGTSKLSLTKTKSLSLGGDGAGILQSRAYQLEMLEDSMRRNIIVVVWHSISVPLFWRWRQADGYRQWKDSSVLFSNAYFSRETLILDFCRAILRIEAELDRCPPEKAYSPLLLSTIAAKWFSQRVWFLCITVPLADQQYHYIRAQLPSYRAKTRFLSGGDGVDRWKKQQIWDDVLKHIRIGLSTQQVS